MSYLTLNTKRRALKLSNQYSAWALPKCPAFIRLDRERQCRSLTFFFLRTSIFALHWKLNVLFSSDALTLFGPPSFALYHFMCAHFILVHYLFSSFRFAIVIISPSQAQIRVFTAATTIIVIATVVTVATAAATITTIFVVVVVAATTSVVIVKWMSTSPYVWKVI